MEGHLDGDVKFCTACGSEIRGGRFCGECGVPLQERAWPTTTTATAAVPAPAAQQMGRTVRVSLTQLPLWELVYPAVAVLLLGSVLFTDWYQQMSWWAAEGTGPHAVVILATLLAVVAAVLGLLAQALPEQFANLPLPVPRLRLLLLAPLALAVVVALVKVMTDKEGMGPGVQLATVGLIVVGLMGVRSTTLNTVRIGAILCLGVALLSLLWPMRHLFPTSAMTFPLLLIGLTMAGLLGWLIRGLVVHSFPDWAAMAFFGAIWVLITLVQDGAAVGGVGAAPLLFLMAGIALALAPGMLSEMEPPAQMADRWLQAAAGFLTYGVFAGIVLGLTALSTMIALSSVGLGEGGGILLLTILAGTAGAAGCGYGRVQLIRDPARGRKVGLVIAGVGVVLAVLGGASTSDSGLGADPAAALLVGLVAPAILAGLLLLPPSVRERYGAFWNDPAR